MSKIPKKHYRIEKELVGKTIKEAILTKDDMAPTIVLEFTDGTTFSLVSEARPKLEVAFYFSGKDGDEAKEILA